MRWCATPSALVRHGRVSDKNKAAAPARRGRWRRRRWLARAGRGRCQPRAPPPAARATPPPAQRGGECSNQSDDRCTGKTWSACTDCQTVLGSVLTYTGHPGSAARSSSSSPFVQTLFIRNWAVHRTPLLAQEPSAGHYALPLTERGVRCMFTADLTPYGMAHGFGVTDAGVRTAPRCGV